MRPTTRTTLIAALAITSALAGGHIAAACQYTVRHVAFVDLGDSPYRLFVYTPAGGVDEFTQALKTASDLLTDSNVVAELVNVDEEGEHAAETFLEAAGVTDFPAAVLVSPDNRALRLGDPNEVLQANQLSDICTAAINSQVRDEIIPRTLDTHSVMILLEGDDAETNRQITQLANNYILQIRDILPHAPKPPEKPPHLIVLSPEQAQAERILLWSLGIDVTDRTATQIAVIFGRGRRIGPVLRFPQDETRKLERSLAAVLQDCECGLDRSWMQGNMIPHIWDEATEKLALAKLNFDPGSPEVKTEIAQLLSRGPSGKAALAESELIFPALGYQEIELDVPDTATPAEKVSGEPDSAALVAQAAAPLIDTSSTTATEATVDAPAIEATPVDTADESPASTFTVEIEPSSGISMIGWVVIGLVAIALLGGGMVLAMGGGENR